MSMRPSLHPTASKRPRRSVSSLQARAVPPSIGSRDDGRPEASRKPTPWSLRAYASEPSGRNRRRPWCDRPCVRSGETIPICLCECFRPGTSQKSRSPSAEAVTRVRESGLKSVEPDVPTGPRDSGHLRDLELADTSHGLRAKLDEITTRCGHDGQAGEIPQGLLAPTGLMPGPQGPYLAEHGTVGLGLGRGAGPIPPS